MFQVILKYPQAATVGFMLGFIVCLTVLALGTWVDRSSDE